MYETIERLMGLVGHNADPNMISLVCAVTYLGILFFIIDILTIFIKFLFGRR